MTMYTLLSGHDYRELEDAVREFLDQEHLRDWKPAGGPVYGDGIWVQALYRD